MFAIVAAVLFGLALLLQVINESFGPLVTPTTLVMAGLLFLALSLIPRLGGRRWRR
ncbi:hypothetical protein JQS43_12100 [Natronosporangium hydrolyticum]|uniref:Uncharacterized protein n=1 Tax=Natronosporangium hydrolyticum TaxID=2811111 RepID=A0A895YHC4_9ACTN|nr:hypothetical protein [Natronosporangium hydrolyticum]QSB16941.1 hypothetical protein JQS43_12100 [Natronosporangium hydrolyticum]